MPLSSILSTCVQSTILFNVFPSQSNVNLEYFTMLQKIASGRQAYSPVPYQIKLSRAR